MKGKEGKREIEGEEGNEEGREEGRKIGRKRKGEGGRKMEMKGGRKEAVAIDTSIKVCL